MKKQNRSVKKLVLTGLIAFATYGMLNHWTEIKQGFLDGLHDGWHMTDQAK